jgi:hypothetical protein
MFTSRVEGVTRDVEDRFQKFDESVTARERESENRFEELKLALSKLNKRNEIVALADRAILGSGVAYRKLEDMSNKTPQTDEENAVAAELLRVYSAYDFFAPNRCTLIRINASAVNPAKSSESELTADELLPILQHPDPLIRAKIGTLLNALSNLKGFKIADSIAKALEVETHLEAFRFLRGPFTTALAPEKLPEDGTLDCRITLSWWKQNRDRLEKEHIEKENKPPEK